MQEKEKNNTKKKSAKEKPELTQWHPAFCSATKLELVKNKKDLHYHSEYGLNTKPIQIDLLVIRKSKGITIENEIGKIFKGHNLFEYKSPKDKLNVDTYFKTVAYACLYKTKASTMNGIDADDITISILRESKPVNLFKWFQSHEYEIEQKYNGIYYVKNHFHFDTQIIVLKELNPKLHLWLTSLTQTMETDTAEKLILEINNLTEKDDCEYADSVLQVAMKENKHMFLKLKEESPVCEELLKLMEPEMREAKRIAKEEGRKAGMEKGIREGRRKGKQEGMALSITIINQLREGKNIEEIAKETGAEINEIENIRKSLGFD